MNAALTPESCRAYADAIVVQCLDMQPGETLLVDCELGHREIAVAIAESAYRHGLARVDVNYTDRRLQRARLVEGVEEATGALAPWAQARLRATFDDGAAVVRIVGDDEPGVLADVDSVRLSKDFGERARSVKWFTKAVIANKLRWAIAAWPTEAWAHDVYPELPPHEAVARLGTDLLNFCRLGPNDPPTGWVDHARMLRRRADVMTTRNFTALQFTGPGTDLHVALAPDGIWLGGRRAHGWGAHDVCELPHRRDLHLTRGRLDAWNLSMYDAAVVQRPGHRGDRRRVHTRPAGANRRGARQ